MRQPNILDFVRAVTALAPSHPDVKRWWYSPRTPFALEGGSDEELASGRSYEVVVEAVPGIPLDFGSIASELSTHLHGSRVAVRAHRGGHEDPGLYRLLTAKTAAAPE